MTTLCVGYLCPVETQEGPACGLLKAFALGARVTQVLAPAVQGCRVCVCMFVTLPPGMHTPPYPVDAFRLVRQALLEEMAGLEPAVPRAATRFVRDDGTGLPPRTGVTSS